MIIIRKSRIPVLTSTAVVAIVLGGAIFTWGIRANADNRTRAAYKQLMSLTTLAEQAAPDFTLTDQHGNSLTLSSLKGKAVVLEFMDPQCTDICPVVSQETIQASRALGTKTSAVEFLAVNVNQYHESLKDVQTFSNAQGLSQLANWHFLTGPTSKLKSTWKAYGIAVVPNPSGDVEHSSYMYFINSGGKEAYIASPDNTKATIHQWGDAIAYVVGKLVR